MMPWKLLAFIAIMAVVFVFVGFNLDNRCDISLVFITFSAVPVVITILGAFILGLMAAFFLAVGTGRRVGKKSAAGKVEPKGDEKAGLGAGDDAISIADGAEGEGPRKPEPAKKTARSKRGK